MEIVIEKIWEENENLRVLVEHDYGKENIGLGLQAKYLDPETGKPRWQKEVKDLLMKKYGKRLPDNKIEKKDAFKEWHGKKVGLDCMDCAEISKGKVKVKKDGVKQ